MRLEWQAYTWFSGVGSALKTAIIFRPFSTGVVPPEVFTRAWVISARAVAIRVHQDNGLAMMIRSFRRISEFSFLNDAHHVQGAIFFTTCECVERSFARKTKVGHSELTKIRN